MYALKMPSLSILVILLGMLLWAEPTNSCGAVEENTPVKVGCVSQAPNADTTIPSYSTIGVKLGASNSNTRLLAECNITDGACQDFEQDKFRSTLTFNNVNDAYSLVLTVSSTKRDETNFICMRDGTPYSYCNMQVYGVPDSPICGPVTFINDGAINLYIKCTIDHVYPDVSCRFSPDVAQNKTKIRVSNKSSTIYDGYKEVTCELEMPVARLPEGNININLFVKPLPSLVEPKQHFVHSLKLEPVTLRTSADNHHFYNVKSGTYVKISIHINGTPPPHRFSLRMRSLAGATFTVPSGSYDVNYDNDVLHVTLKDVGGVHVGFGEYHLEASNDVNGPSPQLEYTFTILEKTDDDDNEDKDENNIPLIVGIVVGGVIVIAIIVAVILVIRMKNKKKNRARNGTNTYFQGPGAVPEGCYIYPNLSFTGDDGRASHQSQPPPYSISVIDNDENNHDYAGLSTYSEIGPGAFDPPLKDVHGRPASFDTV